MVSRCGWQACLATRWSGEANGYNWTRRAASSAVDNNSVPTPAKLVPRPKTAAARKERIQKILDTLNEMYPNVVCALHHTNAWELLVATILSAQCTDKRVNQVTPGLFAKYPTIQDFAHASQDEMANDIRSTGAAACRAVKR